MNCVYLFSKLLAKIQIAAVKNSSIDRTAKIYEKCEINKLKLGRYSYISKNTLITDAEIGAFCSIGGNCNIGGGIHPIYMVSTSPVFLSGKSAVGTNFASISYNPSETVVIGNDVWVGSHVYIKAGIHIGSGAIIGAHAVVTHDVAPYSVVAGVPAKEIRKRFDEKTIEKLLELQWWDWSEEKLEKYGKYFNDPEVLFDALERNCK